MKLTSTRDLFAYWDNRRGQRPAPDRDDIDPGAIPQALGDVFMLDIEAGCGHPFRLAGTRLCAAFGRELKGNGFFPLWSDVAPIRNLVNTLVEETNGAVARVTGKNIEGGIVGLEMLLLPLGHRGRVPARFIGSLAALEQPYWLGARPLTALRLEGLRFIGPVVDSGPAPLFTAGQRPDNRQRPTFVVHQGGRA